MLPQTLSQIFHLVKFVKCQQIFWSLILKDCKKVQDKKNKVLILCSRPRQNMKLCTFKLQSCKVVVLLNMNLLLFCHSCRHYRRRCLSFLLLLKGFCHVCLVHFINNANCGSFLATELEKLIVNGKIMASSQTNIPPKHNIKHNKNKNEL